MAGTYHTKQKDVILECLSAEPDRAFSAKEILLACRDKNRPVGLATIYRQLESLVRERRVKKIMNSDNKSISFQYPEREEEEDAFFLKCDHCGRMTPADCGSLEEIASHLSSEHGFEVDTSRSVLYGRCKDCK